MIVTPINTRQERIQRAIEKERQIWRPYADYSPRDKKPDLWIYYHNYRKYTVG